jgi:NADH-quinone oxidoreductase subunit G
LNRGITLALGDVPVDGEDDLYPKGPRGESPAADKVKFTIRAEKCPNRRGVEAVLRHHQGEVIPFARAMKMIDEKSVDGAFIVGGNPRGLGDAALARRLSELKVLIVMDILRSPISDQADFVLAGAAFAEREGTVINHAGLAQRYHIAVRPPGEAHSDGRILMELAGRKGLFHSASILKEMSVLIPAFSGLSTGEVGEEGTVVLR